LFFKRHFDAKKSAIEDFVIRSGTVFDGLNSPVVQAAVLSRGGAIMGIGAIPPVEAVEIAPRHAGVYWYPQSFRLHPFGWPPRGQFEFPECHAGGYRQLRHGCFSLVDKTLAQNSKYGITDDISLNCLSGADYLGRLEKVWLAFNVLSLVPNAQLR
jgi:hypothetical protein